MSKWITAFASLSADSRCPDCDDVALQLAFVGDPVSRLGFGVLYCRTCRHGAQISRAIAPAGFEVLPFNAADDLFVEIGEIVWQR